MTSQVLLYEYYHYQCLQVCLSFQNSGEEILLFDDLNIASEETIDAMASEDDDSGEACYF